MAKNKKLVADAAIKWNGGAFSLICTIMYAIFAFAFIVAIPVVLGVALGVFNVGGDKMMLLITLILIPVFALFGICKVIVIFAKRGVKYTEINGQKMKLKASAFGLFFNVLKWLFFTVVTVGFYLFWIPGAYRKWKAKHTVIYVEEGEEVEEEEDVDPTQPRIVYYTVEDKEE